MGISVEKTAEKDIPLSKSNQGTGKGDTKIKDHRTVALAHKELQQMSSKSPRSVQLKSLQRKAADSAKNKRLHIQPPIQKKQNKTGLPDSLKTGIENLSGYAMDDVKVHFNSPKPTQLQAHAYAQGTNIHLATGQEKYLPHEAWHVVQQKQGRVQPTLQMKGQVNINDSPSLEKEADVMGAKALQYVNKKKLHKPTDDVHAPSDSMQMQSLDSNTLSRDGVIQRMELLTAGLIVGGALLLAGAGYGLYRYLTRRNGLNHEEDPLLRGRERVRVRPVDRPREAPVDFNWAWNATQQDPIGERTPAGEGDRALFISESHKADEQTGSLHPAAEKTRTFYPEEFAFRKKQQSGTLEPDWKPWNWTSEDLEDAGRDFNLIVARSMVCACEMEHFEGDRGPRGSSTVKDTCGGVAPAQRIAVLQRVIALLAVGGRAIFTVSLQGAIHSGERSLARRATEVYWSEAFDQLPERGTVDITVLHFPENDKGEPVEDFFGFVLTRNR